MTDIANELDALWAAKPTNIVADETARGDPFTVECDAEIPGPKAGMTQRRYRMQTPVGPVSLTCSGDPSGDAAKLRQAVADEIAGAGEIEAP